MRAKLLKKFRKRCTIAYDLVDHRYRIVDHDLRKVTSVRDINEVVGWVASSMLGIESYFTWYDKVQKRKERVEYYEIKKQF